MSSPITSSAAAAAAPCEIVSLPRGTTDWMDEFGEEARQSLRGGSLRAAPPAEPATASASAVRPRERGWWVAAFTAVGLLALAQAPIVVMWGAHLTQPLPAASPAPGTLVVETVPSGVDVEVDGMPAGVTPLHATLASGRRLIALRHEGRERTIELQLAPGQIMRQRVDFGDRLLPVEPTPVARPAAAPPRAVAAGPLSGWVRFDVPASMRVVEEGRLLGTTEVDRLMLPAGEHRLDLTSDELRFSTQQVVKVSAGEIVTVPVRLPSVPLSINARPWAEVERVGDTPVGNLLRPLGRHTIVLRHPDLGERRETVVLTATQPGTLSVDLRQTR
jgi:hypothetical protein